MTIPYFICPKCNKPICNMSFSVQYRKDHNVTCAGIPCQECISECACFDSCDDNIDFVFELVKKDIISIMALEEQEYMHQLERQKLLRRIEELQDNQKCCNPIINCDP